MTWEVVNFVLEAALPRAVIAIAVMAICMSAADSPWRSWRSLGAVIAILLLICLWSVDGIISDAWNSGIIPESHDA